MATITGSKITWSGMYGYIYVSFDYDNQVDSNGNITIRNIQERFYYKTSSASDYTWYRGAFSFSVGNSSAQTWGSASGYASSSGTYSYTSRPDFTVYVGTDGGSVRASISASCKYTGPDGYTYASGTSAGSTTLSIAAAKPNPTKSTLSLSTSNATLGGVVNITINETFSGVSNSLQYSFNGSSYMQSSLTSSGEFKLDIDELEPLITDKTAGILTFKLATSYQGQYVGEDTRSMIVDVPTSYIPSVSVNYINYDEPINEKLIAGTSMVDIYLNTEMLPIGNSATIRSIDIVQVSSENPNVTSSLFAIQDDVISSGILPDYPGNAEYSFTLIVAVTDSRGNVVNYTIDSPELHVYCYIPPKFQITSFYRCDVNGNQVPNGTYAKIEATIDDDSTPIECSASWSDGQSYINLLSDIVHVEGTQYTLSAEMGKGSFDIGAQYLVTFKYRSQKMQSYGSSALTYQQLLPTMVMPISLLDDGSKVATSFGEMAQSYNDTASSVVVNFATNAEMRATNNDGDVAVSKAYDVIKGIGGTTARIFVQTTTDIPVDAKDGDIIIVYEE